MAEIMELPRRAPFMARIVSAVSVPEVWPQVCEWLCAAIQDARYTPMDLYLDLAGGRATLWLVERGASIQAAVVTRVQDHTAARTLRIQLCGGERMAEWLHLLGVIEAEARELGCSHIEIEGRKGWARVLPHYRERAVLLVKEIA